MTEREFLGLTPLKQNKAVHAALDLDDFICPLCGSTFFGSTISEAGVVTDRHCHNPNFPCRWSGPPEDAPGNYVETIGSVWQVVEKMVEERSREFRLTYYPGPLGNPWQAQFGRAKRNIATAGTPAMAICLATLRVERVVK